jgi:hypothetical protein
VNIEVVKNVINELQDLKLVQGREGHLVLTAIGENIASLIEDKNSEELKSIFAKLMLENYGIFENFLRRVKEISAGNGVPIPNITAKLLDKYAGDPLKIADSYISVINSTYPNLRLDLNRLHAMVEDANMASVNERTKKIIKLQSIMEKFIIGEVFSPGIKSRRTYDFCRYRSSFLGFANYAVFDLQGLAVEIAYLISDFNNIFKHSVKTVNYDNGILYINYPTFEEIQGSLRSALTIAYENKKDQFGYARIADVRDLVCRELRISDALFDEYLKRLYQEEPQLLSFTYGGASEIITEKSLPIVFEKPMRELFTLLKVQSGR